LRVEVMEELEKPWLVVADDLFPFFLPFYSGDTVLVRSGDLGRT
jgi:hypothetical protein